MPNSYGAATSSSVIACWRVAACQCYGCANRRQPVFLDDRVQRELRIQLVGDRLRLCDIAKLGQRHGNRDSHVASGRERHCLVSHFARLSSIAEQPFTRSREGQ